MGTYNQGWRIFCPRVYHRIYILWSDLTEMYKKDNFTCGNET